MSQLLKIVWPLAVAQTLVWAAMYYSFPALLLAWEQDLGWSKTELSGALTAALLVSAFLAPVVGRAIDRGYGTRVFTGSALLGAFSLALLSGVTALWQFYTVWIILGAAMAGTLYEACFAVLTKTMGERRKQAITIVTLIAGFAGTLSFAGCAILVNLVGWRGTMLVLAAIVSCIAVPLIWLGCRATDAYGKLHEVQPDNASPDTSSVKTFRFTQSYAFWLLALGFSMMALNHSVLLTHLLPLFDERGISSSTAIFAASMIGPMQVVGRLIMLTVERRVSSLGIFCACLIAMTVASLSLLGASAMPLLIIGFVFLQGAGNGVISILRPVITADLLGKQNFGLIAGLLAVPFMGATAAAPTIAALIWGMGGYDLVIWFAIGAAILSLIALMGAASQSQSDRRST